jgi:hypothetical protein
MGYIRVKDVSRSRRKGWLVDGFLRLESELVWLYCESEQEEPADWIERE